MKQNEINEIAEMKPNAISWNGYVLFAEKEGDKYNAIIITFDGVTRDSVTRKSKGLYATKKEAMRRCYGMVKQRCEIISAECTEKMEG